MRTIILSVLFLSTLVALAFTTNIIDMGSHESPEANYKTYCASCHGQDLNTFIDREWLYGSSWNEVFKSIKYGYPDGGMSAYDTTFTDKEIGELSSYILKGIENQTKEDFKSSRKNWAGLIPSENLDFRLDTIAQYLEIPWGIAFLPNNDLIITNRNGKMYRQEIGGKKHEIANVPEVRNFGQGGLLDVIAHPEFEKNNWIYFTFSEPTEGKATTTLMRAVLKNDQLSDLKKILAASPSFPTKYHFGSRIVFDKENRIYFSVGDRGKRDINPQNLDNHCGKILRVNDDGSVPADNPFVDKAGALPEIYSYGHRNPQGLVMDYEKDILWETEHGPRGGDELNIIQKGKNFGWPVISYGINYNDTKFTDKTHQAGMEQPVHYWIPSIGACGLTLVTGDKYPAWKGDLLAGSLSFGYIERLDMENGKVTKIEKLLKNIGRLRDVKVGPDGYIYFSKEEPGMVLRIMPIK